MRIPGLSALQAAARRAIGTPEPEAFAKQVAEAVKSGFTDSWFLNDPQAVSAFSSMTTRKDIGLEVTTPERAYKYVVWVQMAIQQIIESSRRARLQVYKGGPAEMRAKQLDPRRMGWLTKAEEMQATLSPVTDPLELLQDPQRDGSLMMDELLEQTIGWWLLRGWVLWYTPLGAGKTPLSITVIPPDQVMQPLVSQGRIVGYKVRSLNGNLVTDIPLEEIAELKRWDPISGVAGLSPLQVSMLTADSDRAQAAATQDAARRGTLVQGILTSDSIDIDEPTVRKVRAEFESKYGGPENVHKVPVVWGGLKWQRTGLTPRELSFIESRRYNREEIGAIYHVPPVKMGDWSNSYYNSREQLKAFWRDALEPLLQRLKSFLDYQFLPAWGESVYCDWDTSDVTELQEDGKDMAAVAQQVVAARLMSPNRARQLYFNLPPYPGGDVVMGSLAEIQVGTDVVEESEQGEERTAAVKPLDAPARDVAYSLLFKAGKPVRLEIQDTPEALARYWARAQADIMPQMARMANAAVKPSYQRTVEKVSALIQRGVVDVRSEMDVEGMAKRLFEASFPLVRAFYREAGNRGATVVGIAPKKFDVSAARMAWIDSFVSRWASETMDGSVKEAESQIAQKLREGGAVAAAHDEIIDSLRGILLGTDYRSEMASRTVIQGANNNATMAAWGEAEWVKGKRWLAGPPGPRRRELHQQMSGLGKVYALNEPFVLPDGATGMHPGDPNLGLSNIINCGCVMVAALEEKKRQ